jgi:hypothetical protein
MTSLTRFLFRFARMIAGRDRREWVDAMEAEAASAGGESDLWAAGCLWAAIKDRFAREWRFVLAVLLLPIASYGVQLILFFPVVWLSQKLGLPRWTFIAVNAALPLALAFVLGRMRPGLGAYLALPLSFAIWVMAPLVVFWISFGDSPFSWFGSNATWFMMPPLVGLSCAFLVWLAGAWLGSRSRRVAA